MSRLLLYNYSMSIKHLGYKHDPTTLMSMPISSQRKDPAQNPLNTSKGSQHHCPPYGSGYPQTKHNKSKEKKEIKKSLRASIKRIDTKAELY